MKGGYQVSTSENKDKPRDSPVVTVIGFGNVQSILRSKALMEYLSRDLPETIDKRE